MSVVNSADGSIPSILQLVESSSSAVALLKLRTALSGAAVTDALGADAVSIVSSADKFAKVNSVLCILDEEVRTDPQIVEWITTIEKFSKLMNVSFCHQRF